jgi:hypothetical protein
MTTLASAMAAPRRAVRPRCCLECGEPFAATRIGEDFCGTPCRKSFNNRRLVRGAEIYDLFMALRYQRPLAEKLKLWTALCRAAAGYRREDDRERAGRPSWGDPAKIIDRRPYLRAVIVKPMKRRDA